MIILGIDPGPEQSAYVIWDSINEMIKGMEICKNEIIYEMINTSGYSMKEIGLLAIEVPVIFGNKVWQQIIDISFIAGKIVGKWEFYRKSIKVAPNEWKLHIAGRRGADDQLVKQALMARFGPKGTKKEKGRLYGIKSHLWDALGVAVYAGDTQA